MQSLFLIILAAWVTASAPFLLNGLAKRCHEKRWGFRMNESRWRSVGSTIQLILTALVLGPLASALWLRRGTAFGTVREHVLDAWHQLKPKRNRLYTAFIWGLVATLVINEYLALYHALFLFMPAVTELDLWSTPGVTVLPFAISRLWDLPAAFVWGGLLCLLYTTSPVRKLLLADNGIYLVLGAFCLIAFMLACNYCGLQICTMVVVLYSLVVGFSCVLFNHRATIQAVFEGLFLSCFILLLGCLTVGIFKAGLLLTLPTVLIGVPVLMLLSLASSRR